MMTEWIYSESADMLINKDKVDAIFLNYACMKMFVSMQNGKMLSLAQYADETQCKQALAIVVHGIRSGYDTVTVPTPKEMEARTRTTGHIHAADGKKTVRRGGS